MVYQADKPKDLFDHQVSNSSLSLYTDKKPISKYEYHQTGIASWYGNQHRGLKMVNGKKFDPNVVSFAHPNLPINSIIRVTNLGNGKKLTGRLTDRGPFTKSRILDVSEKAAKKLGFKKTGLTQVKIEVLKSKS
jgi:rare lipoprotein A